MKLLEGIECALNHYPSETPNAVNFLCQMFTGFEIQIPICQECVDALNDDDWILLFCVTCAQSKWIFKPKSKKPHLYDAGEHVKWMESCPNCGGKEDRLDDKHGIV